MLPFLQTLAVNTMDTTLARGMVYCTVLYSRNKKTHAAALTKATDHTPSVPTMPVQKGVSPAHEAFMIPS